MGYHQAQNIFYCGASGEPVGLGCQAGNREILTIMGAKSGLSKFPAAPKSLTPSALCRVREVGQTSVRKRREALPRLLMATSAPMWSITTGGRSGNLATNSSFPPILST